ncbi:hypothetical protein, partial [Corynebacterium riegelii]|uniref:hypothetical protein n=1 Tax=Corynebacterium riegelii TaxID=156976 RepID=UPI00288B2A90
KQKTARFSEGGLDVVPDLGQMSDEMSAELSPTPSPSPSPSPIPEATMSKGSSTTNRDPSQVPKRKTGDFSVEKSRDVLVDSSSGHPACRYISIRHQHQASTTS